MRPFYVFLLFLFVLSSCIKVPVKEEEPEINIDPLRIRAEEIALSMNDNLLAAQLLISGIDGTERLSQNMIELLTEIPAGGIMFFRYNLNTNSGTIKNFLSEISILIKSESGIEPFMAVDHEGGSVNRFPSSVTQLQAASLYWPYFLDYGAESTFNKIENDSFRSASDISSLGFNMNFAPVAEYLINENKDFLERRSYGPDPHFTAKAAYSFLSGMKKAGILCVVKHFPGSAGPDPHYSASVLNVDKTTLEQLIFPFSYLINNGARAIMAAHTAVPVRDSEIASLSNIIMLDWLRGELGFNGIIISDDFIMAAAGSQKPEESAVRSITAGSDMILVWPSHLRQTHSALISALSSGELPRERVFDAVQRIIYEKLLLGLLE